jgi:Family of unknown function (DUF6518)
VVTDHVRTGTVLRAVLPGLALGSITGTATSLLQTVLGVPWSALVNSASPWLAVAFIAGALATSPVLAPGAGVAACAGEVLGYYVTAAARGFPVSSSSITFWLVSGVVGGAVLGIIGRWWRVGMTRTRLIASGALAGCFFLEALRYALVLHYTSRAALFVVVAVLVLAIGTFVRPKRQASVSSQSAVA